MASSRAAIMTAVTTLVVLAASACNPECRFDTDCPDLLVCSEGKCADSQSLDLAIAGRCHVASECASNEQCVAGWCRLPEDPVNGTEPETCTSSRSTQCDNEEVCAPTGQTAACDEPPCPLDLECRAPVGSARPAHSCLADEDCTTGWCRQGTCASTCVGDGTCPPDYSCVRLVDRPPWGDTDGLIRVCVPDAPEAVPCDRDALCPDDLACTYRFPENELTRCDEPMGSGASGAYCSLGWCRSGICLDIGLDRSRCTSPCLETSDCEAGMTCGQIYLLGLPGDPLVQACDAPSEACFLTTDCKFLRDDMTCAVRILLGREHPIFGCRPNAAGRTGAPCSTPQDCSTGLCTPEGVCGQLCDVDSDCRCAYDAECPDCNPGDDCHLPGWYCGMVDYQTSIRTYEIRSCRPPE